MTPPIVTTLVDHSCNENMLAKETLTIQVFFPSKFATMKKAMDKSY